MVPTVIRVITESNQTLQQKLHETPESDEHRDFLRLCMRLYKGGNYLHLKHGTGFGSDYFLIDEASHAALMFVTDGVFYDTFSDLLAQERGPHTLTLFADGDLLGWKMLELPRVSAYN